MQPPKLAEKQCWRETTADELVFVASVLAETQLGEGTVILFSTNNPNRVQRSNESINRPEY